MYVFVYMETNGIFFKITWRISISFWLLFCSLSLALKGYSICFYWPLSGCAIYSVDLLRCLWVFSYRVNLLLYNAGANAQGQWPHYKLPMWKLWTVISITKYTGKWFDLSLIGSYWIKLFFSLEIIADLRCPYKPLPSEFTPMLHAPAATIGHHKEQCMKCAKTACDNGMTEGFGFRWPEFKLWLLFCVTNWMVSVKLLPYIWVLM